MSIVRITSWNAQGKSIKKISDNHDNLLPPKAHDYARTDIDNIMLIQESGSTYEYDKSLEGDLTLKFGRTDYWGHFAQHDDAINKRCTTGIIASDSAYKNYYMRIFHIDLDAVKRPVVIAVAQFNHFPLYIVTVHATANHHVSGREIEAITEKLGKDAETLNWQYLFMGDFNITPKELIKKYNISKNNIVCTGKPTQNCTNELDYAIASDKLVPHINIIHHNNYDSDHLPIYIELDPTKSLSR